MYESYISLLKLINLTGCVNVKNPQFITINERFLIDESQHKIHELIIKENKNLKSIKLNTFSTDSMMKFIMFNNASKSVDIFYIPYCIGADFVILIFNKKKKKIYFLYDSYDNKIIIESILLNTFTNIFNFTGYKIDVKNDVLSLLSKKRRISIENMNMENKLSYINSYLNTDELELCCGMWFFF